MAPNINVSMPFAEADAQSGDSGGKVTVAEIKSYLQSKVAYHARRL